MQEGGGDNVGEVDGFGFYGGVRGLTGGARGVKRRLSHDAADGAVYLAGAPKRQHSAEEDPQLPHHLQLTDNQGFAPALRPLHGIGHSGGGFLTAGGGLPAPRGGEMAGAFSAAFQGGGGGMGGGGGGHSAFLSASQQQQQQSLMQRPAAPFGGAGGAGAPLFGLSLAGDGGGGGGRGGMLGGYGRDTPEPEPPPQPWSGSSGIGISRSSSAATSSTSVIAAAASVVSGGHHNHHHHLSQHGGGEGEGESTMGGCTASTEAGVALSPSGAPGDLLAENRLLKRAVAILTGRLSAMEAAVAEVGPLRAQLYEAQGLVREVSEALRKEKVARYTAEAHLKTALGAPDAGWR
jgi:hypothetical protein